MRDFFPSWFTPTQDLIFRFRVAGFHSVGLSQLLSSPHNIYSFAVRMLRLLAAPQSVALPMNFREGAMVGRDSVEPYASSLTALSSRPNKSGVNILVVHMRQSNVNSDFLANTRQIEP